MSEEVADYVEDETDALYEDSGAAGDDIAEMEARIAELNDEQEKINQLQSDVERQLAGVAGSIEENSIYIGQVDYEATIEELRAHFAACGTIHRVTILCDKFTGKPKGFAYIEFVDKVAVENALKLDDTPFKGRNLKVMPKRLNEPRFARGGRGGRFAPRGGRFRGGRGAGRRGGFRGGWGRGRSYY